MRTARLTSSNGTTASPGQSKSEENHLYLGRAHRSRPNLSKAILRLAKFPEAFINALKAFSPFLLQTLLTLEDQALVTFCAGKASYGQYAEPSAFYIVTIKHRQRWNGYFFEFIITVYTDQFCFFHVISSPLNRLSFIALTGCRTSSSDPSWAPADHLSCLLYNPK
jgi:hypothetical protein